MVRLLLVVLLSGCTINYPIWHGDLSQPLCVQGPSEYQGVPYDLHIGPEMPCSDALACIVDNYDIYIPHDGRGCTKHLAHELNHLVGNHFVDIRSNR
jgi:hypothetical protein